MHGFNRIRLSQKYLVSHFELFHTDSNLRGLMDYKVIGKAEATDSYWTPFYNLPQNKMEAIGEAA
jgi:hypothetical protein